MQVDTHSKERTEMLAQNHKMNDFSFKFSKLLDEFGKGKNMVLSTSDNNRVMSRMISIVQINCSFYFQTDKSFRKYSQIKNNHFVALCIDNIQIEGICEELGHPINNQDFCSLYKKYFNNSYKMYSLLDNERLFAITPTYIERWLYKDGMPFLEKYDIEKKDYKLEEYKL